MRLQEFIAKVGDEQAGKLFQVKKRTAQAWRLGDRRPRPIQAAIIVDVTRNHPIGAVGYEEIYAPNQSDRADRVKDKAT